MDLPENKPSPLYCSINSFVEDRTIVVLFEELID
jgi:hypothetical protein